MVTLAADITNEYTTTSSYITSFLSPSSVYVCKEPSTNSKLSLGFNSVIFTVSTFSAFTLSTFTLLLLTLTYNLKIIYWFNYYC